MTPTGPVFGFNEWINPADYRLQNELNAPIRRMLVGWNEVQPSPTSWNFSQYDLQYDSLVSAHLEPLLVVQAAPCWAHPRVLSCVGDTGTPPDPAYDGAWSAFVARVAQHYPKAIGIEVWNEPNLSGGFQPHASAARYTQLLKEAYVAVKSVAPAMPVISGGLYAGPVDGSAGIAALDFLRGMYAAGAKGFMDGIGIHPYPLTANPDGSFPRYDPSVTEQILDSVRAVRDSFGDRTPLWATEFGVSTSSAPGIAPAASQAQQASDLVTIVTELQRDRDVRVAVIQRLIDPPAALGFIDDWFQLGFGVFQASGAPKPAACALSRVLHGTLQC